MIRSYKITVAQSFEAAHRLHRYRGKCRNIHGHSYTIEVDLVSRELGVSRSTPPGMVVDFKVLKRHIKESVIEYFDHALILSERDELAKHLFHYKEGLKVAIIPGKYPDATSECLAEYFYDLLTREGFETNNVVKINSVRVRETKDSQSEFIPINYV
jgi:6-pyruvoyltetrahydropterin/6-carboxytetrahydropterin synthase